MKRARTILTTAAAITLGLFITRAIADYVYPDPVSGNQPVFAFVCFTTKICPGQVLIDSTGTEKATSGNPAFIDTAASGNLINAVKAPPGLGTANGWTITTITGWVGTTKTLIKGSQGQLGFAQCDNIGNAAATYIQIFNAASTGAVTLGSTLPTQVIPIPGLVTNGFVSNWIGLQYNTGIVVAATTTSTGSSAPGVAINCTFGFN
jgi:hypothetical protein